jgi:hypothetical protein
MSGWAVTVIREVAMTEGAGDNNPGPSCICSAKHPCLGLSLVEGSNALATILAATGAAFAITGAALSTLLASARATLLTAGTALTALAALLPTT